MTPVSATLTVLVNLLPLAGVIWLGWRVETLMLLYWAEAVVVGLFALARILCTPTPGLLRLLIGLFFIGHYGTFCLLALTLVTVFFVVPDGRPGDAFWTPAFAVLTTWGALVSLILLSLPQATAFLRWLRSRQAAEARPSDEMSRPYPKVFLTVAVAAVCGYAAYRFDQPLWAVVLLVLVKTLSDLFAARRAERRRAASENA